jgi:hypothetical protein
MGRPVERVSMAAMSPTRCARSCGVSATLQPHLSSSIQHAGTVTNVCVGPDAAFKRPFGGVKGPLDVRGGALGNGRNEAASGGVADLKDSAGDSWHEPLCR